MVGESHENSIAPRREQDAMLVRNSEVLRGAAALAGNAGGTMRAWLIYRWCMD
jgi:hypothetical protein